MSFILLLMAFPGLKSIGNVLTCLFLAEDHRVQFFKASKKDASKKQELNNKLLLSDHN